MRRFYLAHERAILGAAGVVLFLILWEGFERGWWVTPLQPLLGPQAMRFQLKPIFISSPTRIARMAFDMFFVTGAIWKDLGWSSLEFTLGVALAFIIGIPLGLAAGWYRRFNYAVEPFLAALNATPQVAFLPLLIASGDGVLVNTSSVNGFWASLGPGMPNNAYSTAKFAVRGFTEALIEDLRANAPGVRVAVVMPGHVGTDIVANSIRARGLPELEQLTDAQVEELIPREARARLIGAGLLAEGAPADELRQMLVRANADFRDKAPVSAAEAATVILDGVRSGAWRILIGQDAKMIDAAVRAKPEAAYDYAELFSALAEEPAGPGGTPRAGPA